MTIEQGLQAYLSEETTATGVYYVVFPDNVTFPAIRLQRIGGAPIPTHSGDSMAERCRFQVSCFAHTYTEAKGLALEVKDALSAHSGALGGIPEARTLILNETDLYEPSTRVHHIAIDVDVLATTT